jgi:hypothetical protein
MGSPDSHPAKHDGINHVNVSKKVFIPQVLTASAAAPGGTSIEKYTSGDGLPK